VGGRKQGKPGKKGERGKTGREDRDNDSARKEQKDKLECWSNSGREKVEKKQNLGSLPLRSSTGM